MHVCVHLSRIISKDTDHKLRCENTQLKSQLQEKSSEVQRLYESLNEEKVSYVHAFHLII